MAKDVIIACDFESKVKTMAFLEQFTEVKPFVKIGMELFYSEGPDIVRAIKGQGHQVFLDLKLHDIPNTVKKAMTTLRSLGVDMVNVHASGTKEMMMAAREGIGSDTILLAVTQLTSTTQSTMERDILIDRPLQDVVAHYAYVSQTAGLDGVVCSPLEVAVVKKACSPEFLTVTPGIRYADGDKGDQKRVTSPSEARVIGSDYIVVGRPITQAVNPKEAYERICKDFIG